MLLGIDTLSTSKKIQTVVMSVSTDCFCINEVCCEELHFVLKFHSKFSFLLPV